ncbi:IclR family transcriptional regulator [Dyadobacter psychrotolerans]|uniref:IclR family transcriptional regulator n=1 Tax=Dyadobacter psychrotolerans TaxID=2541721 RepID=A0A4R5DD93_9BACT|nr:IclR family transcriptional regulator C-terminal domain-containing protein [Dyadobacter psychrotolerans]TDE10997.1 IclR family transcriptional regulator [Dyadobacter psychrotolerans]
MIQVINRALDIIELIAQEPDRPKYLGDIANAVGLNHGTCANILKTLVARDFIEQAAAKKGYTLGAKAYALTGNDNYRKDLLEAATGEMNNLTKELNENALLAVMKGNQRIALYHSYSDHDLQVRTIDQKDAYEAASGRLLLAYYTEAEIGKFISRYGLPTDAVWPEASTQALFTQVLTQIRRENLAIQPTRGRQVIGLAVPIFKASLVVASLSVYMPEYRYLATDRVKVMHELRAAAERISSRLV